MKQLQEEYNKLVKHHDYLNKMMKTKDKRITKLEKDLIDLQNKLLTQPSSLLNTGELAQYQNFQIYSRDQDIKSLQSKIQEQNQQIAQLKALLHSYNSSNENVIEELQNLRDQVQFKQKSNEELQQQNDKLLLEKGIDGAFRIELEHLRAQNEIYSNLLGNHPALKDVEKFSHSPAQVELKLLKKQRFPDKPSNTDIDFCMSCSKEIYYYRPCCNLLANIDDQLLFVPQDAFDFTSAFRDKYIKSKNDLLIDELMELLLFELNKFWFQREQTKLFKQKRLYEIQIDKLKRKLDNFSYSEKDTLQTLRRLKQEVKDLTLENMNFYNTKFEPRNIKP